MSLCKKCGGTPQHGVCLLCDMFAAASPPGGTSTGWPMTSMAMGCHADQVREGNEFLAAQGISSREAHHTPDGKLQIESNAARKKVLKAKGLTDFGSFS